MTRVQATIDKDVEQRNLFKIPHLALKEKQTRCLIYKATLFSNV